MQEEDVYAAFGTNEGENSWWVNDEDKSLEIAAASGENIAARGTVPGTARRLMTGAVDNRPMTSNRGSGFNAKRPFDPTGKGMFEVGAAPPLQKRGDNSPEAKCMEMEILVNQLIEESAMLSVQGDQGGAVEKAKEAAKKERNLSKQREKLGLAEQINGDLTYAVQFNLAVQFQRRGLFTEALNTYSLLVRNIQYTQSAYLNVNIGNIYAEQKQYINAIKMYRAAFDTIPPGGKHLRYKIKRNIGNIFIKMGQFRDAISSYEAVMESNSDIVTAMNLLLCYYALGNIEKLKSTFRRMLEIKGYLQEDEDEDKEKNGLLVDDSLDIELKERRLKFLNTVMTAARLIAPVIERDWETGYDYLLEQFRIFELHYPNAGVTAQLEMSKYLNYLKFKQYKMAIAGLKSFEKKDVALRARAATNLAYLYFLEGDIENGEKYADISVSHDPYNAKALVNKGNFYFHHKEYDKARQLYSEAMSIEADCVEAIYNLGLTSKRLGLYDESIRMFRRTQSLVDTVEITYHLADLYFLTQHSDYFDEFNRLVGRVPTDPNVLARIGMHSANANLESQAFHFYLESYRYYQVNMDVISWLGAYFVKNEIYDKALQFFVRASQIQPEEISWLLLIASCHRRRGDLILAKRLYEQIHRRYPENIECVRYLVHLCKDSGMVDEANEWFRTMKAIEQKIESGDKESDEGNDAQALNSGQSLGRRGPRTDDMSPSPLEQSDDSDGDIELPGM